MTIWPLQSQARDAESHFLDSDIFYINSIAAVQQIYDARRCILEADSASKADRTIIVLIGECPYPICSGTPNHTQWLHVWRGMLRRH